MDGLLIILVILYFVVKSSKKNKKKTGGKPVNFSETIKEVGKDSLKGMGTLIDKISEAIEEEDEAPVLPSRPVSKKLRTKPVKAVKADKPEPVRSARESAAAFEANSFLDDQGCVGGSLPHIQHEGELRQEHAGHARRYREEEQAVSRAEEIALDLHAMNLAQLRRVMVVSEVLGKPKALQRRSAR